MAWGDSQYGNFQFQFGDLSPIIEAALKRKKQQSEQMQQLSSAAISALGKAKVFGSGTGPGTTGAPSNLNMSDAVASAPPVDITSSDPMKLRITAYGPSQGEYGQDETIGAYDNKLGPGDAAVSPALLGRFPLRSKIVVDGPNGPQVLNVADVTNDRFNNRVDIWNGQDMGYQNVYGYSHGGVVPQHYARGGVVTWGDPYGNEPLAGVQYLRQYGHLADVSNIAETVARQRNAQENRNQENMQQAYKAATAYLEQQRNDQIGAALIQSSPDLANDPRTRAMLDAGGRPYDVAKIVDQLQQREAVSRRQDYQMQRQSDFDIANIDKQIYDLENQTPGSESPDIYTDPDTGEKFYRAGKGRWSHIRVGSQQSGGPPDTSTTFDAYGREWRKGSKGPILVPKGQAITTDQLPAYEQQTVYAPEESKPTESKSATLGQPAPAKSQPGAATVPPPAAREFLRQHPELAEEFDAKYGAGLAAQILGK